MDQQDFALAVFLLRLLYGIVKNIFCRVQVFLREIHPDKPRFIAIHILDICRMVFSRVGRQSVPKNLREIERAHQRLLRKGKLAQIIQEVFRFLRRVGVHRPGRQGGGGLCRARQSPCEAPGTQHIPSPPTGNRKKLSLFSHLGVSPFFYPRSSRAATPESISRSAEGRSARRRCPGRDLHPSCRGCRVQLLRGQKVLRRP